MATHWKKQNKTNRKQEINTSHEIHALQNTKFIWVRSRNCGCLVTWFCYQLIAKPGNKTAAVSWPDPSTFWISSWTWISVASMYWKCSPGMAFHSPGIYNLLEIQSNPYNFLNNTGAVLKNTGNGNGCLWSKALMILHDTYNCHVNLVCLLSIYNGY